MEEIALVFSSLAGACTAVALDKIPRRKHKQVVTVNSAMENQLHSLTIEKEILTKTITRLYNDESIISGTQHDRLLVRYQHQLGVISAKIEKIEIASRYPDLGPVGDSLITLMDNKLSKLDQRLYEISSKMSVNVSQPAAQTITQPNVQPQPSHVKQQEQPKQIVQEKPRIEEPKVETWYEPAEIQKEKTPEPMPPIEIPVPQRRVSVELSTLTEIPSKMPEFPVEWIKPAQTHVEIPEIIIEHTKELEIPQAIVPVEPSPLVPKQEHVIESPRPEHVEKKIQLPTPMKIPEEEKIEDDDKDLDKIKNEIMKALSKLEQAEVE
ncbi:MAG: hypothetical protein ACREBB_09375 [Nitrosotalea sp.]